VLRLQIKNIIKKSQLSLTKNRKKVLRVFLTKNKPLSTHDIQSLVGNIDRVTLFRILSAFEDKKIIHIIRLDNGQKLFALCTQDCDESKHIHNHVHFQCTKCDDVSCISVDNFPQFQLPQYVINNVNININGLCINCNL
jgi:Fur family ferric uptake transcriptional regulator|tara:strand:+ start:9978 stop:10394 length:417 start_codon:yes stop_codon:yes gene_type:complete